MKYMQFPSTTVILAKEIKKSIDDYKARKITNDELIEVITFWSKNSPELLFDADNLKKSINAIIGKRRADIVNKILVN